MDNTATIDFRAVGEEIAQLGLDPAEIPVGKNNVTPKAVDVSVVIPTYNAQFCLVPLYERLVKALTPLSINFEIIFIEDCSYDDTWLLIEQLARANSYIRAFKLSRNFGQHAAITAGLTVCRGKYAVVMDCDLQDPPEDIPRLLLRAFEGSDVVMGRRVGRQQSFLRRCMAKAYFGVLAFFSLSKVDGDVGTLSVLSRKVIDAFLQVSDRNRHYLMILQWLGFSPVFVDYVHGARFAGKSSYSLLSLMRHAFQGVFFQTTILLQLIVGVGLLFSLSGLVLAIIAVWNYLFGSVAPGWTSIIVLILVVGGVILLSLGVVGLYVGQVFDQVKQRPLFILSREVSSESSV